MTSLKKVLGMIKRIENNFKKIYKISKHRQKHQKESSQS